MVQNMEVCYKKANKLQKGIKPPKSCMHLVEDAAARLGDTRGLLEMLGENHHHLSLQPNLHTPPTRFYHC